MGNIWTAYVAAAVERLSDLQRSQVADGQGGVAKYTPSPAPGTMGWHQTGVELRHVPDHVEGSGLNEQTLLDINASRSKYGAVTVNTYFKQVAACMHPGWQAVHVNEPGSTVLA